MISAAFRQSILQQAASDDLVGRLQGRVHRRGRRRAPVGRHRDGAAAAVIGTSAAASGGGALVVVGVMIASLAAPTFIRYRAPT
jgi:hypothetical protein